MQIKLLKSIVSDIAGKQATEIVDLLAGKKDVNEFIIAKKLKLTINQTRNILYKLSDAGLVSFIRKKDKRKGWYIYFWTLNSLKSLELLENNLLAEILTQEKQLASRKTKRFYSCNICNVEVGEETALLNNFTCQECGQVYILSQNDKLIKEIENNIAKLRKYLETIREEKLKESEKQVKKGKARGKGKKRKKKVKKKRKIKKKSKRKIKKKVKKKAKKKPKKKSKKKLKKKSKLRGRKKLKKKTKKKLKKKSKKKIKKKSKKRR